MTKRYRVSFGFPQHNMATPVNAFQFDDLHSIRCFISQVDPNREENVFVFDSVIEDFVAPFAEEKEIVSNNWEQEGF